MVSCSTRKERTVHLRPVHTSESHSPARNPNRALALAFTMPLTSQTKNIIVSARLGRTALSTPPCPHRPVRNARFTPPCASAQFTLSNPSQTKNIMVSCSTRKDRGCYISILDIIQGEVDPTQVRKRLYVYRVHVGQ